MSPTVENEISILAGPDWYRVEWLLSKENSLAQWWKRGLCEK